MLLQWMWILVRSRISGNINLHGSLNGGAHVQATTLAIRLHCFKKNVLLICVKKTLTPEVNNF